MSHSINCFTPNWIHNTLDFLDETYYKLFFSLQLWRVGLPRPEDCPFFNNFPFWDYFYKKAERSLDLQMVADITGLDLEEVEEYYAIDFADNSQEKADVSTVSLVSHIEWQQTISGAYDYAESSGLNFDHVMGEILGGVY